MCGVERFTFGETRVGMACQALTLARLHTYVRLYYELGVGVLERGLGFWELFEVTCGGQNGCGSQRVQSGVQYRGVRVRSEGSEVTFHLQNGYFFSSST